MTEIIKVSIILIAVACVSYWIYKDIQREKSRKKLSELRNCLKRFINLLREEEFRQRMELRRLQKRGDSIENARHPVLKEKDAICTEKQKVLFDILDKLQEIEDKRNYSSTRGSGLEPFGYYHKIKHIVFLDVIKDLDLDKQIKYFSKKLEDALSDMATYKDLGAHI